MAAPRRKARGIVMRFSFQPHAVRLPARNDMK
jgi:hypothetical protein